MKVSRGVFAYVREVFDVARALVREPTAVPCDGGPSCRCAEGEPAFRGTLDELEKALDGDSVELPPPLSEGLAVLVEDLRAEANAADERTAAVTRTNDQLRDELTAKAKELEELRKASGYVVAQRTRLWLVLAAIRLDCGQLVRDAEARVAGGWKPESEGA